MQKLYGALIDASVGMDTTAVSPDLSTVTFVGPRPPDPGDTGCGEGVPCPRFALFIQDLRTHKAPRILVRDAGPASFSPDGKRLAFVAENQLVLRALANGKSTVDQDREGLADAEHSAGLAAALICEPPVASVAVR